MERKTIPEIRQELDEIAHRVWELSTMLKRRPAMRRSKVKSLRVTEDVKAQMRRFADDNPSLSLQEIANAFGVNSGRVSEALRNE